MAGMLEGLKVIDMGHAIAIPAAGAILADWGAEVIKVEPHTGDMHRGLRKSMGINRFITFDNGHEINWVIEVMNRNKKGIAIDLKQEAGREVLHQLVAKSDVFMSNYEVSTLTKFNMSYENLKQLNPRLIYALLTGYGTKGPDKAERGFDLTAGWARGGIQHVLGQVGLPPPPGRFGMMDRVAGEHIVAGITTALFHREKTGEGQKIECSLYQSSVWTLCFDIQAALVGLSFPQNDRTKSASPVNNSYRTRDDRWLQMVMPQSDIAWPAFCRVIERPDLERDPRFSDMELREQNCEELIRILDKVFASRDRDDWEKRLRENDCIYGRIQTPMEVANDPQALANNFFYDMEHPAGGKIKLVNSPVNYCQNPASIREPAPELGQHTEEVLLDLGYSWDDIARLKDEGVIL